MSFEHLKVHSSCHLWKGNRKKRDYRAFPERCCCYDASTVYNCSKSFRPCRTFPITTCFYPIHVHPSFFRVIVFFPALSLDGLRHPLISQYKLQLQLPIFLMELSATVHQIMGKRSSLNSSLRTSA